MSYRKKKQKRLLRRAKWKNRLTNAFTLFFLFILISFISGLLTALYYGFGGEDGKANQAMQVVKTATQMTMPNVYLGSSGLHTNLYFTADMDLSIKKQLGRKRKTIGQLEGKMFLNQLTVNRDWHDGQYDVQLYFLHPWFVSKQSEEEQGYYEQTLNQTWDTLELLPEGTVSELAITFDDLYEFTEVYELLEDMEVDIVWYAIDTGTEKNGSSDGSPYLSAISDIWGFHEDAVFDLTNFDFITERGDGDKREEAFTTGLKFLAENEKLTERYLPFMNRDVSIDERYRFVEEHGVNTYGVVVTGPSKELLKLQENEAIIYATMGDVDFWNWYNNSAGGTIYN